MTSHKPDIVEVASKEGIELKQKGKSCWGQCPFHEDNTPSFKIDLLLASWAEAKGIVNKLNKIPHLILFISLIII